MPNDEQSNKCELQPRQPKIEFPQSKNAKDRKFVYEWFKQFPWLDYDKSQNVVFCFCCRNFQTAHLTNKTSDAFTKTGFCNWRKAIEKFQRHEKSKNHPFAIACWENKKQQVVSIAEKVNSHHHETAIKNRKCLQQIVEAIHFLSKQGLPLRGHNEGKEDLNKGNFLELISYITRYSELLQEYLKKDINYTSPSSQNEFISLIASQLRKKLLPKQDDFYGLMADETCDISTMEQMSVCFRFVDDDLLIHENFLGFYELKSANAESIFNLLNEIITNDFKLPLDNMVAQSYDGAATMSGCVSGVQSRFLNINPRAVYVHCYAHKLNLGLNDACNSIKDVSDVLLDIQNLSVFVERSAKRHALFQHIQGDKEKTTLKKLCETRWASRYFSLKAIVQTYSSILTFLNVSFIIALRFQN